MKFKMYKSQAVDLHVIKGVHFPFWSKLLVEFQSTNNANKFSKVICCLKF